MISDLFVDRFKTEAAIEGKSLLIISPVFERDRAGSFSPQPVHDRESQKLLKTSLPIFLDQTGRIQQYLMLALVVFLAIGAVLYFFLLA